MGGGVKRLFRKVDNKVSGVQSRPPSPQPVMHAGTCNASVALLIAMSSGDRAARDATLRSLAGHGQHIVWSSPQQLSSQLGVLLCLSVWLQSADYDPHHPGTVRRDGSYIYEEFLTTGGTDVKVYTVGPRWGLHTPASAQASTNLQPLIGGEQRRCDAVMLPVVHSCTLSARQAATDAVPPSGVTHSRCHRCHPQVSPTAVVVMSVCMVVHVHAGMPMLRHGSLRWLTAR